MKGAWTSRQKLKKRTHIQTFLCCDSNVVWLLSRIADGKYSTLTCARLAISWKSFVTFAVVGSKGIVTFSIWITFVLSQTALINVLKKKFSSDSITKFSILYNAQTTNNSYFALSDGSHVIFFTRDLQNVDRRRSEKKR